MGTYQTPGNKMSMSELAAGNWEPWDSCGVRDPVLRPGQHHRGQLRPVHQARYHQLRVPQPVQELCTTRQVGYLLIINYGLIGFTFKIFHEILNYYIKLFYQTWIYCSERSLRESRPRALNIGPGRAAGSKFSVVSNLKKNEEMGKTKYLYSRSKSCSRHPRGVPILPRHLSIHRGPEVTFWYSY